MTFFIRRRWRTSRLVVIGGGTSDVVLFDVAAVEPTGPAGSRVSGRHNGRPNFALFDGYAADPGHLNASGSQRVAAAWLAAVAKASSR